MEKASSRINFVFEKKTQLKFDSINLEKNTILLSKTRAYLNESGILLMQDLDIFVGGNRAK